jgi:hypothetical protein
MHFNYFFSPASTTRQTLWGYPHSAEIKKNETFKFCKNTANVRVSDKSACS